ncbi:winged helix-turn-helix transcriptional regulator [Sphingomonas sp. S2-65]|uniref:winged helix-turn-helix transcriptional regulator n=1 Tax=Sphingomonas sp. S2-65 TaxID=2903960 RepID=UPI001F43E75F|nr:helix-turn-helix domain-containing protein [Sphingomonas sp. S2-65]UYY58100.1 helix-turn-helix transcriptional regulator [Sphingomonas sp. S2-65]
MRPDHDLDGVRVLIELLADKWTVPVLGALCAGGGRKRFNAIRRELAEISPKSLTVCLQRLEFNGLVERHVATFRPLAVEYRVTPLGHTLELPVGALLAWSDDHAGAVRSARSAFLEREQAAEVS